VLDVSQTLQRQSVSLTYLDVCWDLWLLKIQNLRDEEAELSTRLQLAISKCDERLVIQLREQLEKNLQVKSKLRNALRQPTGERLRKQ
jgi:hypothetical protein